MSNSRSFAVFGVLTHGMLAACLFLCGCEKSEQIKTYSVPKYESIQTKKFLAERERRLNVPEQKKHEERMMGVIIPRGDMFWFFKLQGNPDAVAAYEQQFRQFLKTVHFPAPGEIDWKLPDNWKQLPKREMRYATLVIDAVPPLEISVVQLPARPEMPIAEQVLANINRWRNQLSLPPVDEQEPATSLEKIDVADSIAFLTNIVGLVPDKPPASLSAMAQPQPAANLSNSRPGKNPPIYETPDGWVQGNAGFAVVAFQVIDGDQKILVTVTPAAGSRLDNVNRWRGQLQLTPQSNDEIESSAKKIQVGPLAGELYELTNDGRTILGVIVEDHGQSWFIKLSGDAKLAGRERPHFLEFLKSLKWPE